MCFRIDTSNTQHSDRTSKNCKIIRLKVIVQIRLRLPFTHQQGRILVCDVEVEMKRPASLGALDRINQAINGLKELGTLVRLHGNSGCVHNHRVTLPHTHDYIKRAADSALQITTVQVFTPGSQEGRMCNLDGPFPLQASCTNRGPVMKEVLFL